MNIFVIIFTSLRAKRGNLITLGIASSFLLAMTFKAFFLPNNIYAKEKSENISLSPAYQDVELTSDQDKKQISFTIVNNSKNSLSFEIFPVNFAPKDENGGLKLFEARESSYLFSLASYISVESDRIDLSPFEKRKVAVTIQNRQDLSPGGHYAAIIVRQVVDSGHDTKIAPAISTLIYLKKTGGERFNLSLKEVTWPSVFIHFSYPSKARILFQNEGNIHLIPYGQALVTDMFGRTIYKGIINVNSFFVLPDSRRYIFVDFSKISNSFPISFNTVSISGSDSLRKVTYSYKDVFLYINLPFAIFLSIIILGFYFIIRWKKRKNK